jgi:transposase-like protein
MHYKSAGYRDTMQDRKKLYRCLVCGKKFTPDSAFLGMRHSPEVINQCIDLYLSGLSLHAISQHMKRTRGIKISHMAVYRWIRKFSRLLKPYVDSFKINGQDTHLHADEMMVQLKGEWAWLWSVLSRENRFVLASRISRTRDMNDAKALFKEAKGKVKGLPMRVTTDGMMAYPRAINSAFYKNEYPRVEHYVAPGITGRQQNNLIERHHNTIRSRTKTMRGFGEMGSASDIMTMWRIYFNYLRPNMALDGKTPAESAGLGSRNLLELIGEAYEWNRGYKESD